MKCVIFSPFSVCKRYPLLSVYIYGKQTFLKGNTCVYILLYLPFIITTQYIIVYSLSGMCGDYILANVTLIFNVQSEHYMVILIITPNLLQLPQLPLT